MLPIGDENPPAATRSNWVARLLAHLISLLVAALIMWLSIRLGFDEGPFAGAVLTLVPIWGLFLPLFFAWGFGAYGRMTGPRSRKLRRSILGMVLALGSVLFTLFVKSLLKLWMREGVPPAGDIAGVMGSILTCALLVPYSLGALYAYSRDRSWSSLERTL